jgi:hypothetical protein
VAFAENLDTFLDVDAGFAIAATLAGVGVRVIFDSPGVDVLDGQVATTEPSCLVPATEGAGVGETLVVSLGDLPTQLAHLAGTYKVREVYPEQPDGAFVRALLVKTA